MSEWAKEGHSDLHSLQIQAFYIKKSILLLLRQIEKAVSRSQEIRIWNIENLQRGDTAEACIVEPVARIADAPERCPDAPIAITPTTTS